MDGKRVGKLAHITFDSATHAPLRIVMERGGAESGHVRQRIGQSGCGGAHAHRPADGARPALTAYHADSDLGADVRQAIEKYGRMRVDIAGVDIQAVDGEIWLRGHVSSELNRRLAEDLSRGVVGVAEIHNLLITDPDLAASISSALARDPRTAEDRIGVYPSLGRVHLRGSVHTAGAREAAAQIAAADHSARQIINELRVDSQCDNVASAGGCHWR